MSCLAVRLFGGVPVSTKGISKGTLGRTADNCLLPVHEIVAILCVTGGQSPSGKALAYATKRLRQSKTDVGLGIFNR